MSIKPSSYFGHPLIARTDEPGKDVMREFHDGQTLDDILGGTTLARCGRGDAPGCTYISKNREDQIRHNVAVHRKDPDIAAELLREEKNLRKEPSVRKDKKSESSAGKKKKKKGGSRRCRRTKRRRIKRRHNKKTRRKRKRTQRRKK